VVSLATQAGHSTLIKDLVRSFQVRLLQTTVNGTEAQRVRMAHTIATGTKNAAILREIAKIGTDSTLNIDDKIKQMRELVAETLQELKVQTLVEQHEIDELMALLKQLLDTPDLDIEYETVTNQVMGLLEQALNELASAAQPNTRDPLDYLRRRLRVIVVKFRHKDFPLDPTCDKIIIAIGYQCCLLGLTDDALPDLGPIIDEIHTLLEGTQKRLA